VKKEDGCNSLPDDKGLALLGIAHHRRAKLAARNLQMEES